MCKTLFVNDINSLYYSNLSDVKYKYFSLFVKFWTTKSQRFINRIIKFNIRKHDYNKFVNFVIKKICDVITTSYYIKFYNDCFFCFNYITKVIDCLNCVNNDRVIRILIVVVWDYWIDTKIFDNKAWFVFIRNCINFSINNNIFVWLKSCDFELYCLFNFFEKQNRQ